MTPEEITVVDLDELFAMSLLCEIQRPADCQEVAVWRATVECSGCAGKLTGLLCAAHKDALVERIGKRVTIVDCACPDGVAAAARIKELHSL